jgi:ATP/maltotriose-dependent transcriptional regulator MalT
VAADGTSPVGPAFGSFGEMLRFLRRRGRLTQRQLGAAVGYTEGHISRLEQNQRTPDLATLAALFVPALGLEREPRLAGRLLELAAQARGDRPAHGQPTRPAGARGGPGGWPGGDGVGSEPVPPPPPHPVTRHRLLAELRERLAGERRVAVCGLAGMGKTTLMADLAREREPVEPVCWVTLTEGVSASAEALVRHLAWFLRSHGQPEASRLLNPRPGGEPPTLDEQLGLLGAALGRRPVLLCLDNAHLLRGDAPAMLAHLVATTPVTALLTSREELALPGVGVLRLGGLDPAEAHALIAAAGVGLSAPLAERLVARTAGSPMLLRLALGQLHGARGDPALLVERLESEPQVTSYLLATTLGRLSEPAARLLSLLAVFRRPVDLHDERLVELVQSTDGPYDFAAALAELPRRQLVDHPAAAGLHPLVHDHVYAGLVGDLPRRRRLHRLAATWWLGWGGDPLEAAHHLGQAGELAGAVDLLAAQTDTLIGRGQALAAADLAGQLLGRVRALPGDHTTLIRDLLVVRGDLLVNTVRAAEAEAAYREAHGTAPTLLRSRLAGRLAQSLIQRGRAAEAVRLCRDAAAALAPTDVLLQAQLAAVRCQAHQQLAQHDEAVTVARRALELVDLVELVGGDSLRPAADAQARAHAVLGDVLRLRGQWSAAIRHLEQAVDAARRAERPELAHRAMFALGAAYNEQGDPDRTLTVLTEVLAALRAVGDSYFVARTLQAICTVQLTRGELEAALDAIDQARELRTRLGDAEGVVNCWSLRAEVLMAQGRLAEARELMRRVVAESERTVSPIDHAYNLTTLAVVQLMTDEAEAAVVALRAALTVPDVRETMYHLQLEVYLALALLVAGDAGPAEELLRRAGGGRDGDGDLYVTVELDRWLLRVALSLARGDPAAAARHAAGMARYAEAKGHTRDQEIAVRLLAATERPPPLAELVRLAWGA